MIQKSITIVFIFSITILKSQENQDIDSLYSISIEELSLIRTTLNLPMFQIEQKLNMAAKYHAEAMANNVFFNHINSSNEKMKTPGLRAKAFQYKYTKIAENIAYVETNHTIIVKEMIKKIYKLWRKSAPHWQNITSTNYNEIGIGIYVKPKGNLNKYYFVQVFGNRD